MPDYCIYAVTKLTIARREGANRVSTPVLPQKGDTFVRDRSERHCKIWWTCAHAHSNRIKMFSLLLFSFLSGGLYQCVGAQTYVLDDSAGLGRRFDGIGGLSGGGVSYNMESFLLHITIPLGHISTAGELSRPSKRPDSRYTLQGTLSVL